MKYSNKLWFNFVTKEVREIKPLKTDNWIRFDSKQEFAFYQLLSTICSHLKVKIIKDYRLQLAKSSIGNFDWKIDFALFKDDKYLMSIEYKGDWVLHHGASLASLKYQLVILELTDKPTFDSLLFVGSKEVSERLKINILSPKDNDFLAELRSTIINRINNQ